MKVLDRYLIRETIAPFLLALAVYTFVLAVDPMLSQAQLLLSKGVPIPTVAFMLATLLPQALGVTIPMAFLTGLLIALGRMSGDRESVALLACGVSPLRLLRPVLLLGAVIGLIDLYVMVKAVPDGNLAFVEARWKLLSQQSETDIKPRIFFERFPGMVLYVNDEKPGGGWDGVLLAETSPTGRPQMTPTITTAESGLLLIDREEKLVRLILHQATRYSPGEDGSRVYSTSRQSPISIAVSPEAVFGSGRIDRGLPEMRISDLKKAIADKRAARDSPHNEIMYLHQKFSFPVACLVFAMLGLALGLNTRKEGKLAGLTLGLAVILVYWGLMGMADAWTKAGNWEGARSGLPAEWARWLPNIVLGFLGAAAVWWRGRSSGGALTLQAPEFLTRWRRKPVAAAAEAAPAGTAAASPRTVVVIRIPRLSLPAPRILDRYVSGRYLRTIGLAFVSLISLYYVGTFLDMSQKLFKGQADTWMFLSYLWYSTPKFIAFAIPSATLVAVLGTIGGLTRTGELTVMRACGVSLYRTALPLLLIGVVWSGVLFMLDERVLTTANRRAEILSDVIRGRAAADVRHEQHELAGQRGHWSRLLLRVARRTPRHSQQPVGLPDGPLAVPRDEPHLRCPGHLHATRRGRPNRAGRSSSIAPAAACRRPPASRSCPWRWLPCRIFSAHRSTPVRCGSPNSSSTSKSSRPAATTRRRRRWTITARSPFRSRRW